MSEVVAALIDALAPTVAGKLSSIMKGKRLSSDDMIMVLLALQAENNQKNTDLLASLNGHLISIEDCTRTVGEGVLVLLKRTEHLGGKR